MGSSSSSARHPHDDTVDFGALTTQGVYTGPQDWNHQIVGQLIVDRRLAPYYRPLEDYEEDWGEEAILAARREQPNSLTQSEAGSSASSEHLATHGLQPTSSRASSKNTKSSISSKDTGRFSEAAIYRGAVECPICFLYFPSNINRSRCCDHPICTECFVQIKRSEPSPTHLSSDPACCPYCVQENFGVTYAPPQWRAGIGAESAPQHMRREALQVEQKPSSGRKKSFSADSPDVVTTDQIRPDWEEKLAAVRAAVQRRANRRIIMRQVGDRLIPVGVTSGRIHPIGQDIGADGHPQGEATPRSSRRSRRNGNSQTVDINQFLGMNGQDLEELMVMEAMRLSLVEHEETQRNQARQANSGSETGGDNAAPRGQAGTPDSENRSSTPQSFILPSHSTAAVSASTSIPRGRGSWLMPTSDTSQGQRRSPSSSHSAASPLAQAASSIAMGIGIPIGAASASRTPSRSPSPVPAVTATEHESTVQQPPSNGEATPGVIHPSSAEASSDIPATGIMADNNPDPQVAEFSDEPIVPSPMPITTNPHEGSDGVETETEDPSLLSPASSTNIPASYKALPSTPEDSIMTQPLIDKTGSVSSSTYQHGAAQYNGHAASQ